jgi:hypothetical protein
MPEAYVVILMRNPSSLPFLSCISSLSSWLAFRTCLQELETTGAWEGWSEKGGREGAVSTLLEWAAPVCRRAHAREMIFEPHCVRIAQFMHACAGRTVAGVAPCPSGSSFPSSKALHAWTRCNAFALMPSPGETGANAYIINACGS